MFTKIWKKWTARDLPALVTLAGEQGSPLNSEPIEESGFDEESALYFKSVAGDYGDQLPRQKIFVAHQRRLELYKNGLDSRIRQLLWDYRLKETFLRPEDIIVDIGANNGEFGIWATRRGARYFGFEPDPAAFEALKRNVPSQQVFDCAISNIDGVQSFFLATSDADSSLFRPENASNEIKVQTQKFDTIAETLFESSRIRLLKVEAEGMEPEVLEGAVDNIGRVEYITVDAGPERGGESTAVSVLNFLFARRFELLDCFLFRGTFLLRNIDLTPSQTDIY